MYVFPPPQPHRNQRTGQRNAYCNSSAEQQSTARASVCSPGCERRRGQHLPSHEGNPCPFPSVSPEASLLDARVVTTVLGRAGMVLPSVRMYTYVYSDNIRTRSVSRLAVDILRSTSWIALCSACTCMYCVCLCRAVVDANRSSSYVRTNARTYYVRTQK